MLHPKVWPRVRWSAPPPLYDTPLCGHSNCSGIWGPVATETTTKTSTGTIGQGPAGCLGGQKWYLWHFNNTYITSGPACALLVVLGVNELKDCEYFSAMCC